MYKTWCHWQYRCYAANQGGLFYQVLYVFFRGYCFITANRILYNIAQRFIRSWRLVRSPLKQLLLDLQLWGWLWARTLAFTCGLSPSQVDDINSMSTVVIVALASKMKHCRKLLLKVLKLISFAIIFQNTILIQAVAINLQCLDFQYDALGSTLRWPDF